VGARTATVRAPTTKADEHQRREYPVHQVEIRGASQRVEETHRIEQQDAGQEEQREIDMCGVSQAPSVDAYPPKHTQRGRHNQGLSRAQIAPERRARLPSPVSS
jgi:hypothetical protein